MHPHRQRRGLLLPLLVLCLTIAVLLRQRGPEPVDAEPEPPRAGLSAVQPSARPSAPAVSSTGDLADSSPASILAALTQGKPLRFTILADSAEADAPPEILDLYLRPMRALGDDFQITLGADFTNALPAAPHVFEGWAVDPAGRRRGRTTVALVDGALSAFLRAPDGSVTELRTDPATGERRALRLTPESAIASCTLAESDHGTVAATSSDVAPFTDADWLPAEIAPLSGDDPATGEFTKYEQPSPNGALYDLSLPDATVMVVLAKDATGSDSPANLASKASTYLARMANVATIWENQLGIRLLVSELVLTPDTAEFDDVGETLGEFRSWGESNRPRDQFPRSVAARFGNLGFSGNVVGLGFVGSVAGSVGYNINKTSFNFTLVAHEMGHNFGSNHSAGGIMNSSYQGGQRDFFRDVTAGETAAKDIYDHAASRLFGPATMRHAEEIPFAHDDSLSTPVDTPQLFEPLGNDEPSVRNGATNTLSIAEVSRIYPIGAGTAQPAGDAAVLFTPADGYQGFVWFSYSLQGDVGNGGQGWLHRGDVAILVGSDPSLLADITLAPGESVLFDPPGSGSASIQTAAVQAIVDVTRDDNSLLIIRADAAATGTDSFVVRRSGTDHTINITYAARPPVGVSDVVLIDSSSSTVRFSPMANDEGIGYRRPLQLGARIGVDGVSEDYFANAFRLVSATNLNPEKGALTLEMLDTVSGGSNVFSPTGIMTFNPVDGATGVAVIEYVIEDAAGNQATETVSVVLSLLQIASPASDAVNIPQGVGLVLEATTGSASAGALSGQVDVTWESVSAPPGASATIADPHAEQTSVRFSDPGTYLLRATGSDKGYPTSQELTVLVTDTAPGGENLGAAVALTNSTLAATTAAPFDLSAALPVVSDDGFPAPPAAVVTAWTQVAGAGLVVFGDPAIPATTATFPFPGSYTLRLTADDGEVETFDDLTIDYTGPGNGTPVATGIADVTVSQNAADVVIELFPAFEDGEDSDADLVYTLEANTDPVLFTSAAIAGDPEQLTLQFAAFASGVSQLTVRATDTNSLFAETTFTVTVSNSAPSIAPIADQSIDEGQNLNLSVMASDPENDGLSYSIVAGSPSGMAIDPVSGALSWTPGEADGPGTHPVVVRAVDDSPAALAATQFFKVNVGEVNEAPDIAPIADFLDFAQPDFTLAVSGTDPDLPANSLRYFLDIKPAGASIGSGSGVIHWTPSVTGSYAFTVRVDDLGTPNLSDSESFTVEVSNAAPTMADQSFSIAENSAVGTEVGSVVASDGDGDGFTFAIAGGNAAGAFEIDPDSGLITVADSAPLDFEAASAFGLTVEATDDGLPPLVRVATITVTIIDVNEAPSLPDQTFEVAVGELFGAVIGTVAASDPEGDTLSFAITAGNGAGVFSIDPTTGELGIAAQAIVAEETLLTISATDSGAPARSDSGIVTVRLIRTLVPDPADARVFVPADDSLSAPWKAIAFDDSGWTAGQTGVGYERDSGYEALINTDVEAEMHDTNASVWIRIPFNIAAPSNVSTLTLRMQYDDGFVAYLNGTEIARRNAPAGTLAWDASATVDRDDTLAVEFEDIDLTASIGALVPGANVLAVHGLNESTTSPDMLILPELVTTESSGSIGLTTLAELATGEASTITESGAVLHGELTFSGGEDPEVFFAWGTADGGTDPGAWDNTGSLGVLGEGSLVLPIGGLIANTTYFFRCYAINSAGTAWSEPAATFTSTPVQLSSTLIATGATAQILVPADAAEGIAWRDRDYDDSAWGSGATGIGYERSSGYEPFIATDIEAQTYNQNSTVYLRLPFELVDPASLSSLTLRMRYDDAYVAFINGTEVARSSNAPAALAWDSEATAEHDAEVFEDIDLLAAAASSLLEGENVLAIHGMNASAGSSDLLFVPELIASFAETSYAGWITSFPGLQGDDRLLSSDPDGDGMNNLLEFAFGWNPGHPETAASGDDLVRPEIRQDEDGVTEIRFRRRIDHAAQGLVYEIQTSFDLSEDDWFPGFADELVAPVPTGDGLTEVVTVTVFSFIDAPRLFFRVVVSRGE